MSGSQPPIADVAALVGGRALTASELAYIGGVSPQTASGHLSRLTEGGLLLVHKQGRHSYFRLASPLIGQMLEGIMAVAAEAPAAHHRPRWRGGEALRLARTCYDHLAGRVARLRDTRALQISARGRAGFAETFGIELPT